VLHDLAAKQNAVVGAKVILPSSFTGSTSYYAENFEDGHHLRPPDFFIAMTCNRDRPAIKEVTRIISENKKFIKEQST